MKSQLCLVILTAFCLLCLRSALAREWTDSSGTYKIEAELVKLDGEVVHLKKANGTILKVPLNKLCADDQEFTRQQFVPKAATAPAPGEKAAEFARRNSEFNTLMSSLKGLKPEYAAITDTAKKAEIAKQFKEGLEKAKALTETLLTTAKQAYQESPNADPKTTEFLLGVLADLISREEYAKAFLLGKLLLDNNCPDPFVPALAGIAAYRVNQYDLADKWLKVAKASGALSKVCEQYPKRDYATLVDLPTRQRAARGQSVVQSQGEPQVASDQSAQPPQTAGGRRSHRYDDRIAQLEERLKNGEGNPEAIRKMIEYYKQMAEGGARRYEEVLRREAGGDTPSSARVAGNRSAAHTQPAMKQPSLPAVQKNSVDMEFALIPAGEFLMGSPESEKSPINGEHDPSESPRHRVRITKPFYMGIYPVTQFQYFSVCGSNPSYWSDKGPGGPRVTMKEAHKFPVECITWEEARIFCDILTRLPEEQKAGRRYRLPTEAQWEYACRAGTTTPWYFGNNEKLYCEYGWCCEDSGMMPNPVGQKKPNRWGLYDMCGNVYEWCADWYDEDYYAKSPTDDPPGPATGSKRVVRGGAYSSDAWHARSAGRGRCEPGGGEFGPPGARRTGSDDDLGMRVVLLIANK